MSPPDTPAPVCLPSLITAPSSLLLSIDELSSAKGKHPLFLALLLSQLIPKTKLPPLLKSSKLVKVKLTLLGWQTNTFLFPDLSVASLT